MLNDIFFLKENEINFILCFGKMILLNKFAFNNTIITLTTLSESKKSSQ